MFENVLGQAATVQLIQDIDSKVLAPAMLFSGPDASGKGTAALELGRVISCEGNDDVHNKIAPWNCDCSACARHRFLLHPDILCLGSRSFTAEISASAGAFLREVPLSGGNKNLSTRMLFIRSVRKLLARFNPAIWGDETKTGKASITSLVNSIEEDLDELTGFSQETESVDSVTDSESITQRNSAVSKLTESIVKSAIKLEAEGISEIVPIAHIRRAAYWSRLAPQGRGKLLVIENADRMLEEARNSLLKIMEEPPARLTLVLTTTRPGSLLPTMLSRLRPYRFYSRDAAVEGDVIRRVFKDETFKGGIAAYLESFLPVSSDTLKMVAAFFAACVAYKAALLSKRSGRSIPDEVVLLGKYTAPKAEAAGFGRPTGEVSAVISFVLEKTQKFGTRSLFSRFLCDLLAHVSQSQKDSSITVSGSASLPNLEYNEIWKKSSAWAEGAVVMYGISPAQALEKLFTDLGRGLSRL